MIPDSLYNLIIILFMLIALAILIYCCNRVRNDR